MSIISQAWDQGTNFLVGIKNGNVRHIKVDDKEKMPKAAEILNKGKFDVYWAIAGFNGWRKAENANYIKAFWVDIDCGPDKPYKTLKQGKEALLHWAKNTSVVPPTSIVESGNGLHVYWVLDEAVPHHTWLPVAQKFKACLKVGAVTLAVDQSRTADAASILRVPGTYNFKDPENPKEVKEIFNSGKSYSLSGFNKSLPAVGPSRVIQDDRQIKVSSEWDIPEDYPASSAAKVATNCQQIRYFQARGGAVSEPYWRAGLSVIYRCENGENLIHEWSQGDERYSHPETQQKAAGTKGPATCQHFEEVNPEGCTGCKAEVTSPIQLGITVKVEPPPEEEDWRLNQVGRFKVTSDGIWYEEKDAPAQRISFVPIWVREVREKSRLNNEQDESALEVEWDTIDGRKKIGVIKQSHIHDVREFKKWLANHNIISGVLEVKLLVSFISQYTLALIKKHGATEYHESLGWYDGGFVIGDKMVTESGAVKAQVHSTNPISKLTPKGDLDKWKQAANVLNKEEYKKHALCVLLGFASPLYAQADVNSAVISLVGRSGGGKTLAAQFALSIFGNPGFLTQGSTATDNSIEQQLVANRHVPHLLDEVTNFSAHRLANYVYLAANGQGKSALTRTREFRSGGEWRLTPFITSNNSLLEMAQNEIQEAHRRRLLEMSFESEFPQTDAQVVYQAMMNNYGVAGAEYLRTLNKLRPKLPELFAKAVKKIRKLAKIPDANRFSIWSLAAAYLGGSIAKSIGLIDYDLDAVIKTAVDEVNENVAETKDYNELALETVREFITHNSKRVCFWKGAKDVGVPVDDPVVRVFEDTVAIHVKELTEAWRENKVSKNLIRGWLNEVVVETKSIRLAPGCPPVRAYKFKAGTIGINDLLEKEDG